ncbi:hypothetical protein K438DRAFT_2019502 [Mycena galopus ATCC 62051]|nr:hypothetical protein K438DRAFT_2019502 [Mycena galopus ATCC 62051]
MRSDASLQPRILSVQSPHSSLGESPEIVVAGRDPFVDSLFVRPLFDLGLGCVTRTPARQLLRPLASLVRACCGPMEDVLSTLSASNRLLLVLHCGAAPRLVPPSLLNFQRLSPPTQGDHNPVQGQRPSIHSSAHLVLPSTRNCNATPPIRFRIFFIPASSPPLCFNVIVLRSSRAFHPISTATLIDAPQQSRATLVLVSLPRSTRIRNPFCARSKSPSVYRGFQIPALE